MYSKLVVSYLIICYMQSFAAVFLCLLYISLFEIRSPHPPAPEHCVVLCIHMWRYFYQLSVLYILYLISYNNTRCFWQFLSETSNTFLNFEFYFLVGIYTLLLYTPLGVTIIITTFRLVVHIYCSANKTTQYVLMVRLLITLRESVAIYLIGYYITLSLNILKWLVAHLCSKTLLYFLCLQKMSFA